MRRKPKKMLTHQESLSDSAHRIRGERMLRGCPFQAAEERKVLDHWMWGSLGAAESGGREERLVAASPYSKMHCEVKKFLPTW